MPITYDEAYAKTNPELNDNQRADAARAIMAGTAANDAYWQHTDELTRLKAHAAGHGAVPGPGSDTPTNSGVIESTASEDTPVISSGNTDDSTISKPESIDASAIDTIATLRKQLTDSGVTPAA